MGSHLLGWAAVALYLAAEVLAIASLRRPKPAADVAGAVCLAVGLALHFADLELRARALGSVPYRTLEGSVSLFGWMLAIAYLALWIRHRERAMGPFLIPIVVVSTALGMLLPSRVAPVSAQTRGALFARLPALEVIGRMNRTSVSIGLVSLALALAIGVARAQRLWGSLGDPKI